MSIRSVGRARSAGIVLALLLTTISPESWAAKACKCLHKHVTTGTGPVQIETCLLGYREKGTRIKRVTHVRQVMRNLGDRSLTMHFSDYRGGFNPIVSINGTQTGCGHHENYIGGRAWARPTDGEWSEPAWSRSRPEWVVSPQLLEPGASFTEQFLITRRFECEPSMDDSHSVSVRIDHEFVFAGDKVCAPFERGCRNADASSRGRITAKFPDVRLAVVNSESPQCVVK